MLAGEVYETAKNISPPQVLPYFAVVVAARSLSVLANPLHVMYTKINKFLNKGPFWNLEKLPSYWVDRVLLHPPTDDETHYEEIRWMLDILIDGLRTPSVSSPPVTHIHICLIPYDRIWRSIDAVIFSSALYRCRHHHHYRKIVTRQ